MSQVTPTETNTGNTGFWKELESWKTPEAKEVGPPVEVGSKAPWMAELRLPDGKPTIVVFLRHCGCPFAEKTFKSLAALSEEHHQVHCIAVSHSSGEATDHWLPQVGGSWDVDMVIDEGRDIYAKWGLGISSTWHAVNPVTLWSVFSLGKNEGIWNRPTESGSRWQTSGAFAVDRDGTIRWAHVSRTADDLPDLQAAATSLGFSPTAAKKSSH
ncbi:Thioredoxin domain-containing protein [Fusarium sp. LHS14.1]|nr:Thioredoxin domain-containing protein [Fusarium sp. LHS14.1]